jgi:hypothetical protein
MATSNSSEQFHTVVIRGNLPKIEKKYKADMPMDLPQVDYWINRLVDYLRNIENNYKIERSRFKVQHTISNGPCKFFYVHSIVEK